MAAIVAVISLVTLVACDKDDDKKQEPKQEEQQPGGDTAATNVGVKIIGTQVANVGETYVTLLCWLARPDGEEFTSAESEAILAMNPQAGFCMVEGNGTPTLQDTVINCTESLIRGGVMSGTFNNLRRGVKYTVRAWCTIADTTLYSENVTFTAQNMALSLVSPEASNISDISANVSGRFIRATGRGLTPEEFEDLMSQHPQTGFCLVEGEGTPTIQDVVINCVESVNQNGEMNGTFQDLKPRTKYTVRAWFTLNETTIYSDKISFTTKIPAGYVDLGLTSGLLWKQQPEEGFYSYSDAVSEFGDNLPTKAQFEELLEECLFTWDDTNKGRIVTGPNGKSIFLPAAGYRDCGGEEHSVGIGGYFWTSNPKGESFAWTLFFSNKTKENMSNYNQCHGFSVLLVTK